MRKQHKCDQFRINRFNAALPFQSKWERYKVMSMELIWGLMKDHGSQHSWLHSSHPETAGVCGQVLEPRLHKYLWIRWKDNRKSEMRKQPLSSSNASAVALPHDWFPATAAVTNHSSSTALKCSRKCVQHAFRRLCTSTAWVYLSGVLFHLGSSIVTGAGSRKHASQAQPPAQISS